MGLFSSLKREDKKFKKKILAEAQMKANGHHSPDDLKSIYDKAMNTAKWMGGNLGNKHGIDAQGLPKKFWGSVAWDLLIFQGKIRNKEALDNDALVKAYFILELESILSIMLKEGTIANSEYDRLYAIYYSELILKSRK
jgi:hypothetical protein